MFGAQCVVVAIDARRQSRGVLCFACGRRGVPALGGVRPRGARPGRGREAVEWAREAARRGAGEILLTSMDRDGTTDGYDLELTRAVSDAVGIPVIASGGAGDLDHLAEAIADGGADAVLCASIFHYGHHTIAEAKQRMRETGVPVRTGLAEDDQRGDDLAADDQRCGSREEEHARAPEAEARLARAAPGARSTEGSIAAHSVVSIGPTSCSTNGSGGRRTPRRWSSRLIQSRILAPDLRSTANSHTSTPPLRRAAKRIVPRTDFRGRSYGERPLTVSASSS